jgi:hypothetical protein
MDSARAWTMWAKVGLGSGSYDGVMSTLEPPGSNAVRPLLPVYPFNEPGQPIALHDGLVEGLAPDDALGVMELSCRPDPRSSGESRTGSRGVRATQSRWCCEGQTAMPL